MKDINEVTEQCILCQENSIMISAEKYNNVLDVPHHPWYTLRSNLFYYKKQNFLMVVDYFSTFLSQVMVPAMLQKNSIFHERM